MIDIDAIFYNVKGAKFAPIQIPLLSFINGSTPTVVDYVTFDLHAIAQDFPTVVTLVRYLCLGALLLILIQIVLVVLRQY